jgi:hypothetical protein
LSARAEAKPQIDSVNPYNLLQHFHRWCRRDSAGRQPYLAILASWFRQAGANGHFYTVAPGPHGDLFSLIDVLDAISDFADPHFTIGQDVHRACGINFK